MLASCDSGSRNLVLIAPESEVDREIATSLVGLFDDAAAIRVSITEETMTGGEALDALADGRADLALISNDQPFRDDIATVMPMYATVLHIAYRAELHAADIEALLRDATVYAGQEGSASRRVFERLTGPLDLDAGDYRFVTDRRTNVDVAVVFAPISPDRLAEYPGVALWSVGTPEDIGAGGAIDAVVLLNPHFRPFVIPVGTYGAAAAEPVVTVAVDKIIVSRKDLSASVVYDLINEILRLRPALGTIHPGLLQGVSGDFDVSRSRFVVHNGTQDYLQRSEPTFVERYSGVAEVLVTLMIASISAVLAGIRIYNRRRKNRIDRFYAAALEIRRCIPETGNEAARQEAANELRRLQDEAFALLVDEKLAADESFRIFITLCNDVLKEIQTDGEPLN